MIRKIAIAVLYSTLLIACGGPQAHKVPITRSGGGVATKDQKLSKAVADKGCLPLATVVGDLVGKGDDGLTIYQTNMDLKKPVPGSTEQVTISDDDTRANFLLRQVKPGVDLQPAKGLLTSTMVEDLVSVTQDECKTATFTTSGTSQTFTIDKTKSGPGVVTMSSDKKEIRKYSLDVKKQVLTIDVIQPVSVAACESKVNSSLLFQHSYRISWAPTEPFHLKLSFAQLIDKYIQTPPQFKALLAAPNPTAATKNVPTLPSQPMAAKDKVLVPRDAYLAIANRITNDQFVGLDKCK